MGGARTRGAAADVQRPFAENSRIDQRVEPEGAAKLGIVRRQGENGVAIHRQQPGRHVAANPVVRDLDQAGLQIDEIAGKVERDDLPAAVAQRLVTADQSFLHEAAALGWLALAHDIAIGGIVLGAGFEREEGLVRRFGQCRALHHLRKVGCEIGDVGTVHGALLPQGERNGLSAAGTWTHLTDDAVTVYHPAIKFNLRL